MTVRFDTCPLKAAICHAQTFWGCHPWFDTPRYSEATRIANSEARVV